MSPLEAPKTQPGTPHSPDHAASFITRHVIDPITSFANGLRNHRDEIAATLGVTAAAAGGAYLTHEVFSPEEAAARGDNAAELREAASPNPQQPLIAMKYMLGTFDNTYGFTNSVSPQSATLSRRHFKMNGKCTPGQRFPDTLSINETATRIDTVYCTGQKTSHPHSATIPSTPDYKPLLTKLGEKAAVSAGIPDSAHGKAIKIEATSRKQMIVSYSKGSSTDPQLRKLTLTTHGKKVQISKSWY